MPPPGPVSPIAQSPPVRQVETRAVVVDATVVAGADVVVGAPPGTAVAETYEDSPWSQWATRMVYVAPLVRPLMMKLAGALSTVSVPSPRGFAAPSGPETW